MSASQTATVTAAAPATATAAYTLFLSPSASQAQLPTAAASTSAPTKTDHAESAAQDEHLPMQFNAAKPVFADKYAERRYVKERLALAYRVLASICHRQCICSAGEDETLTSQRKEHLGISPSEIPSTQPRSGSIPMACISAG